MILAHWVLLCCGWSISLVPPWVIGSHFLVLNREAELKPTTFFSLLLFCVFLSFLSPDPSDILPLSDAYCGYLIIIIILINGSEKCYGRRRRVLELRLYRGLLGIRRVGKVLNP